MIAFVVYIFSSSFFFCQYHDQTELIVAHASAKEKEIKSLFFLCHFFSDYFLSFYTEIKLNEFEVRESESAALSVYSCKKFHFRTKNLFLSYHHKL